MENIKNDKVILIRHSAPNKYDLAAAGTEIHVIKLDDTKDIYVQCSSNPDEPSWHYITSCKKCE